MIDKHKRKQSKWLWMLTLLVVIAIGLASFLFLVDERVFFKSGNSSVDTSSINVHNKRVIQGKGRVALVIGNSNYKHLSSLKNPHSDADAIAERLIKLGFTLMHPIQKTDVQYDLNQRQLIIARNSLLKAAKGKEIAFIYYSGHGASLGDTLEAHILPVDVNEPTDSVSLEILERQSLSLDRLLKDLDQKAELTLAVFDACREIPQLASKGIFEGNRWKGLARVGIGRNRIVAYSGSQGQVVADGNGEYSPYTRKLLDALDNSPDLEIGNFFRKVALNVESYTNQSAEVIIQNVALNTYYLKPKVDIFKLQKKLKERGYYSGQINGVFDPATEDALQRFMKTQE